MDDEATLTGVEAEEPDQALISALNGDDNDDLYDEEIDVDKLADNQFKVKINGVEKTVSKDELIAHYQKNEAGSQKLEEAAAIRKEAETQKAAIAQHQTQLQEALNHFNAQAKRWEAEGQPDWQDLLDNNPHEYLRQKEIWEQRSQEYQQAQAAQAHLNQQKAIQDKEYLSEHVAKESVKLIAEVLPEWKDEALRDRESKDLAEYLTKKGYTREEMHNLNNSRASNIGLVIKAMRYEQLVAKANAAKGKKAEAVDIKPVPTVSGTSSIRKPPSQMTDKEFATWRKSQIAKRN